MLVVERERGRDAAQVGSSSAKPRLLRALSPTSPPLHLLIFSFLSLSICGEKGWVEIFWVCILHCHFLPPCVCVSSCLWGSAGRCVYPVRKGHSICPLLMDACAWCDCCSISIINVPRSRRASPSLFTLASVTRNGGSLYSWHSQGVGSKSVYSPLREVVLGRDWSCV